MTSDLETRQLMMPIQMRAATDEDDEPVIEGYAAKYNKPSEVLGGFTRFIEQIAPGAFAVSYTHLTLPTTERV